MNLIGNILWFIFGGFLSELSWIFSGVLCGITIIGIPFGLQFFKVTKLCLAPFGARVI